MSEPIDLRQFQARRGARAELPELQARLRMIANTLDGNRKAQGEMHAELAPILRDAWAALDELTALAVEQIGHAVTADGAARIRRLIDSIFEKRPEAT